MMKKFKINIYQAAHIAFWSSLIEYLIYYSAFAMNCKNSSVAGLSVSYEGYVPDPTLIPGCFIVGIVSGFGVICQ